MAGFPLPRGQRGKAGHLGGQSQRSLTQSVSRHQPGLPEWDQPRTDFPRRPSDQKALSYPEAQRAV